MRAIFFKELRQHLGWAFLGFLGLGAAEAWALSQVANDGGQALGTLCSSAFLMATTFGCAALGFTLALLQTLPELLPDRWALLIHRPIPRSVIFEGKMMAGLSLYLLAAFVPLILSGWWVATPGHVASPFTYGMMLPGIVDVLAGGVAYLGGLAFALRRASWKGSKAVPLVAVAACLFWLHGTIYLSSALCVVAGIGACLLVVARDAFLDFGLHQGPSRLARTALGILIGVALFLLAGASIYWRVVQMEGNGGGSYRRYDFGTDGAPYIVSEHLVGWTAGSRKLEDLSGHPVAEGPGRPPDGLSMASIERRGIRSYYSEHPYRLARSYAMPVYDYSTREHGENLAWYYVPERRRLEVFGQKNRSLVGTLGPDGYTQGSDGRPFASELAYQGGAKTFVFRESAYWIDLADKEIHRLPFYESARPPIIVRDFRINNQNEPGEDRYLVIQVRDDHAKLYTPAGEVRGTIPFDLSYPPEHQMQLGVVKQPNGEDRYLLYYPPQTQHEESFSILPTPGLAYIYDADGRLLQRTALPPLSKDNIIYALRSWDMYANCILAPPILSVPPLLLKINGWIPYLYGYFGSRIIPRSEAQVWIFRLFVLGVAVTCGLIAWGWTRGERLSIRRSFAITAFVLGPFVLIAAWLVRRRPGHVPCPSCSSPRDPAQGDCETCGSPWPQVNPTGKEIFE